MINIFSWRVEREHFQIDGKVLSLVYTCKCSAICNIVIQLKKDCTSHVSISQILFDLAEVMNAESG